MGVSFIQNMQMGTDKLTSPLGVSTESYHDVALNTISGSTDQFCIGRGRFFWQYRITELFTPVTIILMQAFIIKACTKIMMTGVNNSEA